MVDKIANYGDRAVVTKINEVIDALSALQVGGSVDWTAIQNVPAALTTNNQPAATPAVRTIGTGALQAAAGNHTHSGLMTGSAVAQTNTAATDVAGLVTDFNALLVKLRNRGVIS